VILITKKYIVTWQENVKRCSLFIAVILIVTKALVTRMTYIFVRRDAALSYLLSYVVSVTAAIMSKLLFPCHDHESE